MYSISLILPDFAIILLGLLLYRKGGFAHEFWLGAEKLVFRFLLPPLLFVSICRSEFTLGESALFLSAGISALLAGVAASWMLRYVIRADRVSHASVFQCGFRFNTYIGFALASRFCGPEGLSLLALLIAFWVPISNSIAVAELARAVARAENQSADRSRILRATIASVARNPLIIATVLGLVVNTSGFGFPKPAMVFLEHLGNASLAMGLLCIGAGLRFENLRAGLALIAASTVLRLVAVPYFAIASVHFFGLTGAAAAVVVIFAALPTAQSCYVMTAEMRGNAPLVAAVTTVQTLASMATLSVVILFLEGLLGNAG